MSHSGSLRNSAPVNGAMKGTPASAATGVAEREVGVPTSPIRAKTSSCSIRPDGVRGCGLRLVAVIERD